VRALTMASIFNGISAIGMVGRLVNLRSKGKTRCRGSCMGARQQSKRRDALPGAHNTILPVGHKWAKVMRSGLTYKKLAPILDSDSRLRLSTPTLGYAQL
jgi:hypothetical protein